MTTAASTTVTTLTSVTLPLPAAIEAFAGAAPHASKDDNVPVLGAVQVSRTPEGVIQLVSTDRYTVSRSIITEDVVATEGDAIDFLVPLAAVQLVVKTTAAQLRGGNVALYTVTVTDDGEDIVVTFSFGDKVERSQAFDRVTGNFPAVGRLFPADDAFTDLPAGLHLAPEHLAKVTTFAAKFHKNTPVQFLGSVPSDGPATKMRPVGLRVGNLTALIQPNVPVSA